MPGPPPPPPPNVMPPPPPLAPTTLPKGGKSDDRAALLKSIQKGTKLKKTVTNDKSAPMIGGKISNNNSTVVSPSSVGATPASTPNGLNLGGLFAGGMPKLKPTGKLSGANQNFSNSINNNDNSSNRRPAFTPQSIKNSSSLQNELKKQMANDNRNRGPPPPAPIRNASEENGPRQQSSIKDTSTNGVHSRQSSLHSNFQIKSSTLHRKVKSNANLSTLDQPHSINGFGQPSKPVISHGKPNLAPKPPTLNAKPLAPPKKLLINGKPVSRAHSMKSPRSPSPQSPDTSAQVKFGTVRNLSSVIGQSLANSTGNLSPRPRPMLNGRPSAPPPSIPSQQPPPPPPHGNPAPFPPSKTSYVKPPNHAPPPPPSVLPQPPNHTPPPPPHRMLPSRAPPAVPANNFAPPPPPRHSSMTSSRKATLDLEDKYKSMFHDPSTFPKPPPYRNVFKFYGSRQAGSKQQAPQPPNLQSTSRTWDASSAC